MDKNSSKVYPKPLDEQLYDLDAEEREFFKKETGIETDEELKKHLIAVQTKAYLVRSRCIVTIFLLINLL